MEPKYGLGDPGNPGFHKPDEDDELIASITYDPEVQPITWKDSTGLLKWQPQVQIDGGDTWIQSREWPMYRWSKYNEDNPSNRNDSPRLCGSRDRAIRLAKRQRLWLAKRFTLA